jgi:hypothetical protein
LKRWVPWGVGKEMGGPGLGELVSKFVI